MKSDGFMISYTDYLNSITIDNITIYVIQHSLLDGTLKRNL